MDILNNNNKLQKAKQLIIDLIQDKDFDNEILTILSRDRLQNCSRSMAWKIISTLYDTNIFRELKNVCVHWL